MWMSSSLLPYWTTTSSAGLVSKQILLTGDGGAAGSATASLDFLTRDLTATRNMYVSGNSEFYLLTASLDARIGRNLVVVGDISSANLTSSSGIKTLDFESTRNSSFANLTASAGALFSLDATVTRNFTTNGNAVFISLTGSGGGKFLDLEVTRNSTLANLTSSAGALFSLDVSIGRNLSVTGISTVAALTGTSIKASLDLESTRNILVGGKSTLIGDITGSGGLSCSLDLNVGRKINVTTGGQVQIGGNLPNSTYAFGIMDGANTYYKGGLHVYTQSPTALSDIVIDNRTDGAGGIYMDTADPFHLGVNASLPLDHLVLSSTGKNVGIGLINANINAKLHVSGGTGFRIDGDLNHSRTDARIGLYGNTPVVRPAAYTMNTGITYRSLPSGSLVAQVEGVLRQLIDDLINVGAITGTI